jgi:hypothetical protein
MKLKEKLLTFLILFLFCKGDFIAQSVTKGTNIIEDKQTSSESKPTYHALIIACSDYQHNEIWKKLPETVNESRRLYSGIEKLPAKEIMKHRES